MKGKPETSVDQNEEGSREGKILKSGISHWRKIPGEKAAEVTGAQVRVLSVER